MKSDILVDRALDKTSYYLKIFFNKETGIFDCLEWVQALKAHALVNKVTFCLGELDSETAILARLRLAQARLRKTDEETSQLLEVLQQGNPSPFNRGNTNES